MGAHRMAVAACGVRVVEQLKLEIDQLIKTTISSPRSADLTWPVRRRRGSPGRPPLAEPAEALLHLLLDTHAGGIAERALIGAMARLPNAALVDGLLDALEGARSTAWLCQPRSGPPARAAAIGPQAAGSTSCKPHHTQGGDHLSGTHRRHLIDRPAAPLARGR